MSGQQKYSASCARRLARPPRPAGPSGALACAIAASSACLRAKAASADRPGCEVQRVKPVILCVYHQFFNKLLISGTQLRGGFPDSFCRDEHAAMSP